MIFLGEEVHPPMELVETAVDEFNHRHECSLDVFGETNPNTGQRLKPENITHSVGRMKRERDTVIVTVYALDEGELPDGELVIRCNVKYSEFDYIEEIVFLTVDIIGSENAPENRDTD